MGDWPQVQGGIEVVKQVVEFGRTDHRPWDDLRVSPVKLGYKVLFLFFLYDVLELKGKTVRR